jgi:hypothetical protein
LQDMTKTLYIRTVSWSVAVVSIVPISISMPYKFLLPIPSEH